MSVAQLEEIVRTTDKEWAKTAAQNTLLVIEKWKNKEITDPAEYHIQLIKAASVNTFDPKTSDPKLRGNLFTIADEIGKSVITI